MLKHSTKLSNASATARSKPDEETPPPSKQETTILLDNLDRQITELKASVTLLKPQIKELQADHQAMEIMLGIPMNMVSGRDGRERNSKDASLVAKVATAEQTALCLYDDIRGSADNAMRFGTSKL